MQIVDTLYQRYQLDWMRTHGKSPADIIQVLQELYDDMEDCGDPLCLDFAEMFDGAGFHGELWACRDEFLGAEFQDSGYMFSLCEFESEKEGYLIARKVLEAQKQIAEQGMTLKVTIPPMYNRLDSMWYGGIVAEIIDQNDRSIFQLTANGDVEAELYRGGDLVEEVKDRQNLGEFYGAIRDWVESDDELETLIMGEDIERNPFLELFVVNNNWWEVFQDSSDDPLISESWIVEGNYLDALADMVAAATEKQN